MHLHKSTLCPSHYDVDVRLLSLHDDGDTALQRLARVLKRKIVNYCFSPRQQRGVFIGRMRQEEEGVVLAGWVVALLSTSIYQ